MSQTNPEQSDSATPLTDLQIALSKAVDLARALPPGSVNVEYHSLARVYVEQIMGGVFAALKGC